MTQAPTLAELINLAIENRLLDVHTALIAKVERYDAEKQLVDVSPVLKRKVQTLEGVWKTEQLPLLCDVPVMFPQAGGYFISFPIQSGDFVQLIFNESDIEEWLQNSPSKIDHNRRFSLQGAIAIPSFAPPSKPLTGAHKTNFVAGRNNGPQIHIDDQKIRLGSEKAEEALAIANKVKEELEKIKSAFQLHTHSYHNTPTVTQIAPMMDISTKKVVAE